MTKRKNELETRGMVQILLKRYNIIHTSIPGRNFLIHDKKYNNYQLITSTEDVESILLGIIQILEDKIGGIRHFYYDNNCNIIE